MTAKTDLINNLRNSGIDLAVSTLKRKSMAELETIWSAVQDRDNEAQAQPDAVEDIDLDDFDENGDYPHTADEPEPRVDITTDFIFEVAALALGPGQIATELAKVDQSDGQSKVMKDRDDVVTQMETLKELQKIVTATGYRKDPKAMSAALSALAEQARRMANEIG